MKPTAASAIFPYPGRTVAQIWADERRDIIATLARKPRHDPRDQSADGLGVGKLHNGKAE